LKNHHSHFDKDDYMQNAMVACPESKKAVVSPLGWSINGRLMWAAVASVLLWLSVAWAVGWLS
jgi:hypothetical protein